MDVSTLAKHEELYARLRDCNQERIRERQAAAHVSAVAQAERTLLTLVRSGQTPSLRNASLLTGEAWRPSQLRAIALQMLRMQLGGRHLRQTCKSPNVGDDFRRLVASTAERIQVPADRSQQALPL